MCAVSVVSSARILRSVSCREAATKGWYTPTNAPVTSRPLGVLTERASSDPLHITNLGPGSAPMRGP